MLDNSTLYIRPLTQDYQTNPPLKARTRLPKHKQISCVDLNYRDSAQLEVGPVVYSPKSHQVDDKFQFLANGDDKMDLLNVDQGEPLQSSSPTHQRRSYFSRSNINRRSLGSGMPDELRRHDNDALFNQQRSPPARGGTDQLVALRVNNLPSLDQLGYILEPCLDSKTGDFIGLRICEKFRSRPIVPPKSRDKCPFLPGDVIVSVNDQSLAKMPASQAIRCGFDAFQSASDTRTSFEVLRPSFTSLSLSKNHRSSRQSSTKHSPSKPRFRRRPGPLLSAVDRRASSTGSSSQPLRYRRHSSTPRSPSPSTSSSDSGSAPPRHGSSFNLTRAYSSAHTSGQRSSGGLNFSSLSHRRSLNSSATRDTVSFNTREIGRTIRIQLVKEAADNGLGFTLTSRDTLTRSAEDVEPVYVKKIRALGSANRDGRLLVGDRLISVNGTTVTSLAQVIAQLRSIPSGESVDLLLSRQDAASLHENDSQSSPADDKQQHSSTTRSSLGGTKQWEDVFFHIQSVIIADPTYTDTLSFSSSHPSPTTPPQSLQQQTVTSHTFEYRLPPIDGNHHQQQSRALTRSRSLGVNFRRRPSSSSEVASNSAGLFVDSLIVDGLVASCGRRTLLPGDRLVGINGQNVEDMDPESIAKIISNALNQTHLDSVDPSKAGQPQTPVFNLTVNRYYTPSNGFDDVTTTASSKHPTDRRKGSPLGTQSASPTHRPVSSSIDLIDDRRRRHRRRRVTTSPPRGDPDEWLLEGDDEPSTSFHREAVGRRSMSEKRRSGLTGAELAFFQTHIAPYRTTNASGQLAENVGRQFSSMPSARRLRQHKERTALSSLNMAGPLKVVRDNDDLGVTPTTTTTATADFTEARSGSQQSSTDRIAKETVKTDYFGSNPRPASSVFDLATATIPRVNKPNHSFRHAIDRLSTEQEKVPFNTNTNPTASDRNPSRDLINSKNHFPNHSSSTKMKVEDASLPPSSKPSRSRRSGLNILLDLFKRQSKTEPNILQSPSSTSNEHQTVNSLQKNAVLAGPKLTNGIGGDKKSSTHSGRTNQSRNPESHPTCETATPKPLSPRYRFEDDGKSTTITNKRIKLVGEGDKFAFVTTNHRRKSRSSPSSSPPPPPIPPRNKSRLVQPRSLVLPNNAPASTSSSRKIRSTGIVDSTMTVPWSSSTKPSDERTINVVTNRRSKPASITVKSVKSSTSTPTAVRMLSSATTSNNKQHSTPSSRHQDKKVKSLAIQSKSPRSLDQPHQRGTFDDYISRANAYQNFEPRVISSKTFVVANSSKRTSKTHKDAPSKPLVVSSNNAGKHRNSAERDGAVIVTASKMERPKRRSYEDASGYSRQNRHR